MSLAALLSNYGIACMVIEADEGYCSGSRAICMSRRSQEILGWVGADKGLVAKGLSWVGGRSYWRDAEVLHFEMLVDQTAAAPKTLSASSAAPGPWPRTCRRRPG